LNSSKEVMLGARSCWRLNEDNQADVHGFDTPAKFRCVRAIPVPEVPSPRWAISDTEIACRCRATSKDISKEVAMAKPTTENDDQPMIRHIYAPKNKCGPTMVWRERTSSGVRTNSISHVAVQMDMPSRIGYRRSENLVQGSHSDGAGRKRACPSQVQVRIEVRLRRIGLRISGPKKSPCKFNSLVSWLLKSYQTSENAVAISSASGL
jgi:hypothetical protein